MRKSLTVLVVLLVLGITGCTNGISYIRGHDIGYFVCDSNRPIISENNSDAYDWSPDGRYLAHTKRNARTGRNGLFVRIMRNRVDRQMVSHTVTDVNFTFDWSPDGDAIVFEHNNCPGCNGNISRVEMDNGVISLLTPLTSNDSQPAWAPGGDRIAFVSERSATGLDIFWMNSDGTSRTRLTNSEENDSYPVWSPDSTRIAFIRRQTASPWRASIATVARDETGGAVMMLVTGLQDIGSLSWSPDGSKLLFHGREVGRDRSAIYTVNSDASNLTQISNISNGIYREVDDMFPSWSPNGSKIAFTRSARFTLDDGIGYSVQGMLFQMDANGMNKRRLGDLEFKAVTAWRPSKNLCL
ncbi:MAG: hypothetical protein ABW092_20295 [Candidatus Thiodiazotropha sp.]